MLFQDAVRWNTFGFAVSLFLTLLAVLFLKEKTLMQTFIVLGQGHFFLTYLYQWRANKIGIRYGALYILACGTLLMLFSLPTDPYMWSLVAAGSIFAIHFFVDEMFINGSAASWKTHALGATFVMLYAALLVRYAYGVDMPFLFAALACALCLPLFIDRIKARSITAPETFFLSGSAALLVMLFLPKPISLVSALSFIILFHYTRWYLYYFFKFGAETDPTRFRRYIADVAWSNALIIVAFCIYLYVPVAAFLVYLFGPAYFFAWTILHVLFSIRFPKRAAPSLTHVTH